MKSVYAVAAAHQERREFEAKVQTAVEAAIAASTTQSPFTLSLEVENIEVTLLGNDARTFVYRVIVKAEIPGDLQ